MEQLDAALRGGAVAEDENVDGGVEGGGIGKPRFANALNGVFEGEPEGVEIVVAGGHQTANDGWLGFERPHVGESGSFVALGFAIFECEGVVEAGGVFQQEGYGVAVFLSNPYVEGVALGAEFVV